MLLKGHRLENEVHPTSWEESRPGNPLSVRQFEAYCDDSGIEIVRKVYLRGDWKQESTKFPNWLWIRNLRFEGQVDGLENLDLEFTEITI